MKCELKYIRYDLEKKSRNTSLRGWLMTILSATILTIILSYIIGELVWITLPLVLLYLYYDAYQICRKRLSKTVEINGENGNKDEFMSEEKEKEIERVLDRSEEIIKEIHKKLGY